MEPTKYNPYKPGHIIHPGMFCGRDTEIASIRKALHQTQNGNPQNFLIQGERGIGKTSLLLYAELLAQEAPENQFLVINFELESKFGFSDIVNKAVIETKTQLRQIDIFKNHPGTFLEILKQVESDMIRFKDKEIELYNAIANIAKLFKKIIDSQKVKGILLLIDEADRPPPSAGLGSFLKLLTERLTKINCNQVCIGLSGRSVVMKTLQQSHESSARLFNVLSLEVLSENERYEVVNKGLDEANEKNKVKTEITEKALQVIADLSQGYPYFLQQFAYNCFEADTDNKIDEDDVHIGIFDEKTGAVKQLGENLFSGIHFQEIGSPEYRKVLRYMSNFLDDWVTRKDIKQNSGISSEYVINNALNALKKKGIILPNPDKRGEYRLQSRSFAAWILAFTEQQRQNGLD